MTCQFCDESVYAESIDPPACQKHYEAMLLVSRAVRQELPMTLSTLQRMFSRNLSRLAIEPDKLRYYVEDVIEGSLEAGEPLDPVEIFTNQGGFFWSDYEKRAGFRSAHGSRVFKAIFPDWETFVV
jgi:hypothetical protein